MVLHMCNWGKEDTSDWVPGLTKTPTFERCMVGAKHASNEESTTTLPSHGRNVKIELKNQASPGLLIMTVSLVISKMNTHMDLQDLDNFTYVSNNLV